MWCIITETYIYIYNKYTYMNIILLYLLSKLDLVSIYDNILYYLSNNNVFMDKL